MAASSVDLPASFERHLRAENKSARTVETYPEAVLQLDAFSPPSASTWPPPPAANRYPALRVFSAWLEEEGEIAADAMAKMTGGRRG
jgi:hypothetical protein